MAIRSRFKKLTHKEKLVVHRGPLDAANDAIVNGINSELEVTDPEPNEHAVDKDLGVDRSEIQEHHLQAALSSTQLAAAEGTKDRANYHIPTPESKQALSEAQANKLYPRGTFHDPHGYIKSSATLEESIRGPTYCLDEDDENWLNKYNAEAKDPSASASASASASVSVPGTSASATSSKTKVEGKDGGKKGWMTTDQFEMIMSVLELYVEQKQPFLHLDPSNLPELDEVLTYFEPDAPPSTYADPIVPPEPWDSHSTPSTEWDPQNPWANLEQLKPLVPAVYPWWCLRREDRQGKSIIPGLNFDETNEADPYVCFRRREVKLARKTRKSDALHVERLLRLTTELQAASNLAQLVARRERTKATLAKENKDRWTHASNLLQVKRTWKIVGPKEGMEDDELLFGAVSTAKRDEEARKKRKLDDGTPAAPGPLGIRLTRRPKPSDDPSASSDQPTSTTTKPPPQQGFSQAITKRVEAVQGFIERECARRIERDRLFEDWTSVGLYPRPTSLPERAFRQLHEPGTRVGKPASFRRRVGRGGRIVLDRRLAQPTPVPSRLVDWPSVHSMSSSGQVEAYLAQLSYPSSSDAGATAPSGAGSAAEGENDAREDGTASPPSTSAETKLVPTLTGPFAFAPEVQPVQLSGTGPFAPPLESSTPRERQDSHASTSTTSGSFHTADSRTTAPTEPEPTSPAQLSDDDIEMVEAKPSTPQRLCKRKAPLSDEESKDEWDLHTEAERYTRLFERWRYDADEGRWAGLGLMGTGGMEADEHTVIDDFDPRFVRYRRQLLDADDIKRLQPDPTYLTQAKLAIAPSLPPSMPVQRLNAQQRASVSASAANGTAQAHVQSSPLLSSPHTTPSAAPAQAVQPGKATSPPSFPAPATDAVTRQAANGVQLTIQQQQQLAMQQRMQHLAAIRAQQQSSPNAAPPASSPPLTNAGSHATQAAQGVPGAPSAPGAQPPTPSQPNSYAGVPTGLPPGLPSGLPTGMNMGLGNGLQGFTPQQQLQLLAFQQQQLQQPPTKGKAKAKAGRPSSSGETTQPSPSQRPASSPQPSGATPVQQRAPSNPMVNNLGLPYNLLGLPGGGGGGGTNGQVPHQGQAHHRPSPTPAAAAAAAQPPPAQGQNGAAQNPQVQQLLLQQQRLLAQAQAQQVQQAQQGQPTGQASQQRNAQVQALLSNPQLAASLGRDPTMQAKFLALANQGRLPNPLPQGTQGPQGPPGSSTPSGAANVQMNPSLLMQMQMQLLAKQNQGSSSSPQPSAAVAQASPSLGAHATHATQRTAPSPARNSATPAAPPAVNHVAGINVGPPGVGMGQPNPLLGNHAMLQHRTASPTLGLQQALMMLNASGPNAAHQGSPQPTHQPSPSMSASSPLGQPMRPGSQGGGTHGVNGVNGVNGMNGAKGTAWHQLQMQQLLQMQLAQAQQQGQQGQQPSGPQANLGSFGSS